MAIFTDKKMGRGLKNELRRESKMIINKLLLSISITSLFINQIIIILEKEKLKKQLRIVLKRINGQPLTKKEEKYGGKVFK